MFKIPATSAVVSLRGLCAALCLVLFCAHSSLVGAQTSQLFSPGTSSATAVPIMPPGTMPTQPMMMVPAGKVALELGARFAKDAPPITSGLTWRVYAAKADKAGAFNLIKEDTSPSPTVLLPPGNYIVHVGFGLANAVRPITLGSQTVREVFDLPAGGLRLEGKVGDVRIPNSQISFEVYRGSQFETGDRRPIAEKVLSGDVVVVPEGTYNVVSNYGTANSVVRSDIRVQAGKLTDITVTHRDRKSVV